MKKSLIAGAGVAALGMAVLPFAGVFAADLGTKVDTIKVTVQSTCTFEGEAAEVNFNSKTAGSDLGPTAGSAMTIKCNEAGGWKLDYKATALNPETGSNATPIPFSDDTSATASYWAANVAITGAETGLTSGLTYSISNAQGTVLTVDHATDTATGVIFTPTYKGHLASNQGTGSYEGTMTYTFNKN